MTTAMPNTKPCEPYSFTYGDPADPMRVTVVEIEYQRNGCGGEGFFHFRLLSNDSERPLIAVLFDEKGQCAVVDPFDLTLNFRGDWYEDGLRKAVKERDGDIWPHRKGKE